MCYFTINAEKYQVNEVALLAMGQAYDYPVTVEQPWRMWVKLIKVCQPSDYIHVNNSIVLIT